MCPAGLCLVDTCSDVSLARRDVLSRLQSADESVVISHLGGETSHSEVESFVLEGAPSRTEILRDVFAIEAESLPAGVVALLGVADIHRLGLSLDYIADHPGSHWELARRRRGLVGYCRRLWDALITDCWPSPSARREEPSSWPLLPSTSSPTPREVCAAPSACALAVRRPNHLALSPQVLEEIRQRY
jgi:hypothetical protein